MNCSAVNYLSIGSDNGLILMPEGYVLLHILIGIAV